MSNRLIFSGGGASKSSSPRPDSFKSKDTVEIILGLCEGPIWGPAEGAKSLYLDTTPIVNSNGYSNFKNMVVSFYPGSEIGEQIKPRLGGFSNPVPVAVNLEKNVAVVRTGVQTNIDFIELRLVVAGLYANDEKKGAIQTNAQVKVEYKRSDSATWLPAFLDVEPSPVGVVGPAGSEAVYEVVDPNDVTDAVGSVIVLPSTTPPPDPYVPDGVGIPPIVWIAPDLTYRPHIFDPAVGGGSWVPTGTWDTPNTQWVFDSPFGVNPSGQNRVIIDGGATPTLGGGNPGDIRIFDNQPTIFDGDSWSPPRGGESA